VVHLKLITEISAPIARCFDLSRSIDLHLESIAWSQENAIAGVNTGLIGMGEEFTWRGRHFGFAITHTSRITAYERPIYFQDAMMRGAFKSYCHDHYFETRAERTIMRDDVKFAAPLGLLGLSVEKLVLGRYMRRLLLQRNALIKQVAEGSEWQQYVSSTS
jgi:ligand-binding SRPBCC domain-containing protein